MDRLKTAHTPGPWTIKEGYGLLKSEIGVDGRALATVWTKKMQGVKDDRDRQIPTEWPEGRANAELIAKAPDFHAACIQLIYGDDLQKAIDLARKALGLPV